MILFLTAWHIVFPIAIWYTKYFRHYRREILINDFGLTSLRFIISMLSLCSTFFKSKDKSKAADVFKNVGVDIHSHLLPGIDDGSRNIDESVQLIKAMMKLGFRKLITTPHIMWRCIKTP
jgi:hypothetical protein